MTAFEKYWDSEHIPKHRRGINDMDWADKQPPGIKYYTGDIVELEEDGFGIIVEASLPHDGWPSSYSIRKAGDLPFHPSGKVAWYYELDFKRLFLPSPIRRIDVSISQPKEKGK